MNRFIWFFFPSRIFITKKTPGDMLHRNGWGFFKHTTEIYLYLQIQMFSLICWTKSTPKEVSSLHQTFNFAEKLMTHLRFSPLEKNLSLIFLFLWTNQNEILSELCKKAAERLLRNCCRVREKGRRIYKRSHLGRHWPSQWNPLWAWGEGTTALVVCGGWVL